MYYIAGAIEEDGRFLLVQRPETGLLAKMWHFPLLESGSGDLYAIIGLLARPTVNIGCSCRRTSSDFP